jgi:hypothetical protein
MPTMVITTQVVEKAEEIEIGLEQLWFTRKRTTISRARPSMRKSRLVSLARAPSRGTIFNPRLASRRWIPKM